MTRALAVALAACSAPPVHPTLAPPARPAPDVAIALRDAGVPRAVAAAAPRPAIAAPHTGRIRAVAVTPDGGAALSSDEFGGTRLWPALDGSIEPRVVDLPDSDALALARRESGFAVFAIDRAGGMYIASLDGDGRTRSHVSLAAEPAFRDVVITPAGALVMRADQTLELRGDDGAVKSRLGTEAGQRVLGIAANGARAVVAVADEADGAPRQRARWLALAPLAWGTWFDAAGTKVSAQLAVSPSGERIATLRNETGKKLVVEAYDKTTGRMLASQEIRGNGGIGFVDDEHVAVGGPVGGLVFVDLAHSTSKQALRMIVAARSARATTLLGVGGGHVVTAANGELLIATPTGTEYLGYGLEAPSIARPGPEGTLLIAVGNDLAVLDRQLLVTATPPLALPKDTSLSDLRWAGGDDWLALAANWQIGKSAIGVVDIARGTIAISHTGKQLAQVLTYEPSTRLAAFGLDTSELDRFDPASHTLVQVASVDQGQLRPLSPKLAGGEQVLKIVAHDRTILSWLPDASHLDHADASISLPEPFAAADPAGHALMWSRAGSHLELIVVANGKRIATLPTEGPSSPWPEPSGAHLVEITARAVTLWAIDGTRVWTQPIAGATEALWLDDGAIALVSAGGIARLDPATGAVTAAKCGWKFGLSASPHPTTPRVEPLCVQLDR